MIAAEGVLTAKGGATSHAAVVARGMGKPCVAGCDALQIDRAAQDGKSRRTAAAAKAIGSPSTARPETSPLGELALIPPPSELPQWLATFLSWADELRRMQVWANADTPEDAAKRARSSARKASVCAAPSTCSCRPERLPIVHEMILANAAAPSARKR